jgi:hypothetical protein
LGRKYELGRVIKRGRRRNVLRLKTERWAIGISWDDHPE